MNLSRVARSDLLGHLFAYVLAIVPFLAQADTVFKCKDSEGIVRYQNTKCAQAEAVSSWGAYSSSLVKINEGGKKDEAGSSSVVVRMDAFNAYRLRGSINGTAVSMVVDTGASLVAVPVQLAKQLGLQCFSQLVMSTANGITQNCKSVVHTLQIGQMVLPDVEVVVMNNLKEVLLGQTALGRLKVEQSNGEIRLSTLQ